MLYIVVVISGILLASLVNLYIEFGRGAHPPLNWYFKINFKCFRSILVLILLITINLLLYKIYGLTLLFLKYVFLTAILTTVSMVDVKSRKIPDELVILGIFSGILFSLPNGPIDTVVKLFAGIITAFLLFFISLLSKGGVGMGDIKLTVCLGTFLGFGITVSVLTISVILCGIAAIAMLAAKRITRKGALPFAPFISLSTLIIILFG